MANAVLDASAALAVLNEEPGADEVWRFLPGALMSTVNAAEVSSKLTDGGASGRGATEFVRRLGLTLVSFGEADVLDTARLRETTRQAGLSLGDRACLALAERRGVPAVTTDRIWGTLDVGVEVRLVR